MLGAIAGDVIGSIYERTPHKSEDFPLFGEGCRFTDDTVLSVAVAHAILEGEGYTPAIQRFAQMYPNAGYGGSFLRWIFQPDPQPYGSWGNGSAMRVSPVGWAFDSPEKVLEEAEKSAAVTHDHPEGIKGAQATALAVFMARHNASKAEIKAEISDRFGYDLDTTVEAIRPAYSFDVSCQGSVPQSIVAFLDAESVEDAIRKAISLGGDSDTMACIAGSIAEAFYGPLPEQLARKTLSYLPDDLLEVVTRFQQRYLPMTIKVP